MSAAYVDLPVGTVLVGGSGRIRVLHMQGDFAYVHYIKADGTSDKRWNGWSGSLRDDAWIIEPDAAPPAGGE